MSDTVECCSHSASAARDLGVITVPSDNSIANSSAQALVESSESVEKEWSVSGLVVFLIVGCTSSKRYHILQFGPYTNSFVNVCMQCMHATDHFCYMW